MNYLLLICSDGVPTADKAATMRREIPAWIGEIEERGVSVYGDELAGPAAAKTVRVRDGQTLVSDGPFIETKEFVGGFDIIDCADLDEAIEVAARHPVSWFHMVEVRPFATDPGTDAGACVDSGRRDELAARLAAPVAAGATRYLLTVCVDGIPETRSRPRSPATPRRGPPRWEHGGSERMGTPWPPPTPQRPCACVTVSRC
jgi:hypothetical protein